MTSSVLQDALTALPAVSKGVVVVLSGGMDSTTSLRLAVHKYGAEKVKAISFDYGQRQSIELQLAADTCGLLGVPHWIFELPVLREINHGFSANVDRSISMPTIHDVLGDPAPVTYVANRNMILLSLAAGFAEARSCDTIICGFQSNDTYGYHDTTSTFLNKINSVLDENRKNQIKVLAPFIHLNKLQEIQAVVELDGNVDLFSSTLTCYDPDSSGASCGTCPSCSERLAAFRYAGFVDPIPYQTSTGG